ncbi:MAG: hypothetical protein WDZ50_05060 [Woeseia sp.]
MHQRTDTKAPSYPVTRRDECPASVTTASPIAMDERTGSETLWWKQAVRQVAVSALRLHHYRYVRTRMFHDALSRDLSESACVSRCRDQCVGEH